MSASDSSGQEPRPRHGWSLLAVVAGVVLLVVGYWLAHPKKLTILVVSLDTTRPDHLTPYGYDRDTTPTLARLAREGTIFTNARSTTSWTLPAHMSLFTGMPPDLHNVVIDFQRLDGARRSMGEIFKEADFRTVGLYTAPYVHSRFGFDRGFDFYEQATQYPMAYDLPLEQLDEQLGARERLSHLEVSSKRLAGRAKFFLMGSPRPRNLMFMHFFDPHYDFRAPPRIVDMFVDPAYAGAVNGNNVTGNDLVHADMPSEDLAHLASLYDAELRWVDENLATVIRTLEEEGFAGDTIVAVVSDHGEEFFEDGRFGHRMSLRDEVLRIPLLFWGPGIIPEGRVVEDDVAIYDVLPTLMDYADIPADEEIYGRSLRPLMEGQSLEPRPVTASLTFLHKEEPDYYTRHDAMVYNGLKYIRRLQVPWSTENATDLNQEPDWDTEEVEVYDLREDPGETRDLYADSPTDPRVLDITKAFQAEWQRQREAVLTFDFEGAPPLLGDVMSSADMDVFEMMQMVGYLQGTSDPPPTTASDPPPSTDDDPGG